MGDIKHLVDKEAIERLKDLAESAETCFFCTDIETNKPFSTRPMQVQKVDDDGNLWFVSNKKSTKNDEIKDDDFVQLLFTESTHEGFLSVSGRARISYSKDKIKELWNPMLKTWFPGGVDDPDISVIHVIPEEGYYWDSKHGKMVSFLKILTSMVTGKTMDDGIEGKLKNF